MLLCAEFWSKCQLEFIKNSIAGCFITNKITTENIKLFFCMHVLKIKNCNFSEQTVKLDAFVCRIPVEMPTGIHKEFCCRLLYYQQNQKDTRNRMQQSEREGANNTFFFIFFSTSLIRILSKEQKTAEFLKNSRRIP